MPDSRAIAKAYDGSTEAYRVLSAWGWGPLANLGYYTLLQSPLLLLGLWPFQRRLARESIALLQVGPGQRILDSGCGQGWTTSEIASRGAEVLGVDLLDAQIARARERYGQTPGVHFGVADATRLPDSVAGFDLGDESLDAVHYLEFAFHLDPKDRRALLEQAYRLLAPGGRLVLVDFMWVDRKPEAIEIVDPHRFVRDTWRFDQFEPVDRYRSAAREIGFEEVEIRDWSRQVTGRFQLICDYFIGVMHVPPIRWLYYLINPRLRKIPTSDWRRLWKVMRAHSAVRQHSRYMAIVWEKPRV